MSGLKRFLFVGLGAGCLLISACDQYQETYLSQKRLVVEHERFSERVPAATADEAYYKALAHDYRRYGGDGLYLSFVYDPASKDNTAMHASNQAVEAAKALRAAGVADVKTDILPVKHSADAGSILVSYTRYSALPPEDCAVMPGMEGRHMETAPDYRLGCSTETALARQIARPRDLMGRGGAPETSSGRRAANMGRPHDLGIPNQPLDGESASEEN